MIFSCQYIYENMMCGHKYIKLFIKKSGSYNVITRIKGKLAVPTIRHHKVCKKNAMQRAKIVDKQI